MEKKDTQGIATYNSVLRAKLNDHIKQKLKDVGNTELVPSHGSILSSLYQNDGRMQIKDLYDTLLKQKSTVTEMIKRLEKLGYLTKEECSDDKRVTFIVATQKTWDFKDDFDLISASLLDKVFINFTAEEEIDLVRLLKKAISNFT